MFLRYFPAHAEFRVAAAFVSETMDRARRDIDHVSVIYFLPVGGGPIFRRILGSTLEYEGCLLLRVLIETFTLKN